MSFNPGSALTPSHDDPLEDRVLIRLTETAPARVASTSALEPPLRTGKSSADAAARSADCLSAVLRQRSRAFRANGLVGAFDAEGLEFQDICQQCESCRCGPQGLFHSWRRW